MMFILFLVFQLSDNCLPSLVWCIIRVISIKNTEKPFCISWFFSMLLLKCVLLCTFRFNSTWQAYFTNNILMRLTSSFLNYFFINLKDTWYLALISVLIFGILDVIKEAASGFSPVVVSFIFLYISSQVTTSSACGSSWWYSVNSELSAADFSQLFNPLFTSSGNSQKSNNLNSAKSWIQ